MSSELHLFILWERALPVREQFVVELKESFTVLKAYEITWTPNLFSSNLRRFYQTRLPAVQTKIKNCGSGPFTLFVVRDDHPTYELRETFNSGKIPVNAKTFDMKVRFRNLVDPRGSAIHATNSPTETARDLMLLLGADQECYRSTYEHSAWDGAFEQLHQNLIGATGWKDIRTLFHALNHSIEYVVLRNFDEIESPSTLHGDIDLLTNEYDSLVYIAHAEPVFTQEYRVHHKVRVGDADQLFDFRYTGDRYYDTKWENDILKTRMLDPRGFFIPSPENHFYSLLYHACVHKKFVSEEYRMRLNNLAREISIEPLNFESNAAFAKLKSFMMDHGYDFVRPHDRTVVYNSALIGDQTLGEWFFDTLKRRIKYALSSASR